MVSSYSSLTDTGLQKFDFILLVDDDPVANYLSEKLLCKFGCFDKVGIALNGEKALEIIDRACACGADCPDLIFLDIYMPVMTGLEFLETFRKRNLKGSDKSKVIILTTSDNQNDYSEGKAYGVFEVIQKPLTQSKLREVLQKMNH